MNPVRERLYELRADMARNTDPLDEAELDYLLARVRAESDEVLEAAAWLFGFDIEALQERAAIMEHEGGMNRMAANREALGLALRELEPDLSDGSVRWLSQNVASMVQYACDVGMSRVEACEVFEEFLSKRQAVRKVS